ncbi:hypothetical protein IIV22A_041R [Invertebrate iridescent virus 22]|uniref:Uncharacterized protein n=1 Tax=Invertebrate iridescent virus 22 TaxID=345198 RepID=W8W2A9_9VIRU|nr:hypothetical protein IIV22A_041R [Invertebrate iridescent virus 22]CCV01885.1 hypothetical protein IIV22A_041R [Invertebrate iridescent virus 22]
MDFFFKKGIIFGETAFKIFKKITTFSDPTKGLIECQNFHIKMDTIDFNAVKHDYAVKHGCINPVEFEKVKIKKKSNCKLELNFNSTTCFLYILPLNYSFSLKINLNQKITQINIEDVCMCQINVLLEPLLNLRKCYTINEALMNWSLNNNFLFFQDYFNHSKLINNGIVECNPKYFDEILRWFLRCENILNFVPKKFLNKVKLIQKSKINITNKYIQFMDIIILINKHFTKMVRKYHTFENIGKLSFYNLNFPIELYGNKEDILNPNIKRKSLYLVKKKNDYLHLKSWAILFNLRWFFNTRYNSKKSLGLDGEYGRTINGYGQTFHKYDDVLQWLVTHPNTIEDVEFVVLDPIPLEYIFNGL